MCMIWVCLEDRCDGRDQIEQMYFQNVIHAGVVPPTIRNYETVKRLKLDVNELIFLLLCKTEHRHLKMFSIHVFFII
jgi:hypothetical protein